MIKKEIKGLVTCAHTFFGMYYYSFNALEKELDMHPKNHIDCLIIGPGYDGEITGLASDVDNYIRTYQPFELANAMRNAGIDSFVIDVMDINQDILSEIKKKPSQIKIGRGFWRTHYQRCLDEEDDSIQYYESFFPDCTLSEDRGHKRVQIPENVMDSIRTERRDIITDGVPGNMYDVVVGTTVRGYYFMSCFSNPELSGECKRQRENMLASVRAGGYLITTEGPSSGNGWELLEFKSVMSGSVHNESAGLYRKTEADNA